MISIDKDTYIKFSKYNSSKHIKIWSQSTGYDDPGVIPACFFKMDHACYYRDGSGVYDVFEEHLCEYYITISIKHFVIRAIRLPPRVKNFYFSSNISAFSTFRSNINFFELLFTCTFSYWNPILSKITVEGPMVNGFSLLSMFLTVIQTFVYRNDEDTFVTLISNPLITNGVPIFPIMFLVILGVAAWVISGVITIFEDELLTPFEELVFITGIIVLFLSIVLFLFISVSKYE